MNDLDTTKQNLIFQEFGFDNVDFDFELGHRRCCLQRSCSRAKQRPRKLQRPQLNHLNAIQLKVEQGETLGLLFGWFMTQALEKKKQLLMKKKCLILTRAEWSSGLRCQFKHRWVELGSNLHPGEKNETLFLFKVVRFEHGSPALK